MQSNPSSHNASYKITCMNAMKHGEDQEVR